MSDSLHDRGKAMENQFFAEKDRQLLGKIREKMAANENREALEAASGISDPAVLDSLSKSGITAESLTSVALIPLVVVAWSDDKMEDSEKAAILQSADVAGINTGTPSYQLMEYWLRKKPDTELLEAWKSYIGSLKASLDAVAYSQLKTSVMGRAENIAESAGGFLGLVNKISDSERKVLDELATAFD